MSGPVEQQSQSSSSRTPGESDVRARWGCHSERDRDAGLAAGIAFVLLFVVYVAAMIWGSGD